MKLKFLLSILLIAIMTGCTTKEEVGGRNLWYLSDGAVRPNVNSWGVTIGDYTLPVVDGTPNQVLETDGAGSLAWADSSGAVYSAGTNLTLTGTIFSVDDAFLINNGNDTTTGTITSAGFIVGNGQTIGTTTNNWLFDNTNGDITTTSNVGIGMVDPDTLLQIANNGWFSGKNYAGTGAINMFKINTSDEIEVGGTLSSGSFEFTEDSGLVTAIDMPVSITPISGTPEGYVFKIDGSNIVTIYAEANGSGGIQNQKVDITGDTEISGDLTVVGSFTGSIDVSTNTNLAVTTPIILTDDTLSINASSSTTSGIVELATVTEITTGTDTTRAITPDGLAGSSIFGRKIIELVPIAFDANTEVKDGIFYFHIPASLNGMNLVSIHGLVITAGTTGTTDWQLYNLTDSQDMLSTKLTIDSTETGSDTAVTPAVINTTYDDVATNDVIRLDCDAISTTASKGTIISLEFQLP